MIYVYKELYTDEKCSLNAYTRIKEVYEKVYTDKTYFIMLATNSDNLFDIVSANELKFNYYKKRNNYIVGVAASKDDAANLVAGIVMDVYNELNSYNTREYFTEDKFVK